MSRLMSVREAASREPIVRIATSIDWLDFMLSGGFPRGAVVMFHGPPGGGKSTCMAQAAGAVRGAAYVSAEEDISLVAARFQRLRLDCDLLGETDMARALATVGSAPLVVLDSVQALFPGGVAAAQMAVDHARRERVAVALICQENKAGMHAGLRAIEHLIDATIKIGRGPPRYILTEKNRYGQSDIALFLNMTENGLELRNGN